jgi:hypothetical protein
MRDLALTCAFGCSLAACGSVQGPSVVSDAATPDAPPEACDHAAPWGTPTPVAGLDTDGNYAVWVSADEKTAIVEHRTGTGDDLFLAIRAGTSGPFGVPVRIAASTAGNDYDGMLSGDGLTLYWNDEQDVRYSTRTGPGDPFTASSKLAVAATPALEGDASVTVSGIYFSRYDGTSYGIWFAPKNAGGFDPPRRFLELDAPTYESAMMPRLSADERTIYFLSRRAGGVGERDIWTAARATASAPFSTPTLVPGLNTARGEMPGALTPDGCRFYFTSLGGAGSNIFVTAKPPKQ